jgi:hypothetical protein
MECDPIGVRLAYTWRVPRPRGVGRAWLPRERRGSSRYPQGAEADDAPVAVKSVVEHRRNWL